METTLFLSQLIGPLSVILGLSFLYKPKEYQKLFKKMAKNGEFMFFDGVVETTAGLALVISHNYWNTPEEIVISLLSWAILLEGTLVLLTTKAQMKQLLQKITPGVLKAEVLFLLALGAYLCWVGYLA